MPVTVTDQQRRLVADSFARLVPISSEAASLFYNHLWEIAPETRTLFHDTDMASLGMKLMQTLGVTVRSLHDPDTLTPFLRDLGQRHISYGVTQDQFSLVKIALLWMIQQCLGSDYTPETQEAWTAAYDLIASIAVTVYD